MKFFLSLLFIAMMVSCGQDSTKTPNAFLSDVFSNSDGQVSQSTPSSYSSSYYSAARFLDHSSWGYTQANVSQVQSAGFSAWIDQQLNLPISDLNNAPSWVFSYSTLDMPAQDRAQYWYDRSIIELLLNAPDQLRLRVSWALYNFLVLCGGATRPPFKVVYFNLLQKDAFGSFAQLLKDVSLNEGMNQCLNNGQNVAKSPNENYSRELMQLFSVGLTKLNIDGTPVLSSNGAIQETYTQSDVINMTKAMSGWSTAQIITSQNDFNFSKIPMAPRDISSHDQTAKILLGQTIAAGQSASAELDVVVNLLQNHPNTAPFVSRRLIQSLVSSDPSPQYISRVAQVFVKSGGNLGQVVKTILLDPEARAGDDLSNPNVRAGKIKEPLLMQVNMLKGMDCQTAPKASWDKTNNATWLLSQDVFNAPTVFGDVQPDYKAPQSLQPSPEQMLLNTNEFANRSTSFLQEVSSSNNLFLAAGCNFDQYASVASQSDDALLNLISLRYFRGAMPNNIRYAAKTILSQNLSGYSGADKFTRLFSILVLTPSLGVVK